LRQFGAFLYCHLATLIYFYIHDQGNDKFAIFYFIFCATLAHFHTEIWQHCFIFVFMIKKRNTVVCNFYSE